jgi:hypothetical protein
MHRSIATALLILGFSAACQASDALVVHEWGTFTSLQDERGSALGRINTDDEPVPRFVHQMVNTSLFVPTSAYRRPYRIDDKGVPEGDPNVTMRLETPVLYFHPRKDQSAPLTLDVKVAFRGGWLTQYYPDARARIDGVRKQADAMPSLTRTTVGRLTWRGLILNSTLGAVPQTDDRVWTAPRAVSSAAISADNEREQFLFYRGVGHVDAPLRVVRSPSGQTLDVRAAADGLPVSQIWLVDIRADGSGAYRAVPTVTSTASVTIPAQFTSDSYSRDNLAALHALMRAALVADGLFADEADALLATWDGSYFRNPGERVFFLVPRTWTDAVLPLNLSVRADVTRVMVGRIELVTPAQRALLRRMAQAPSPDHGELQEVTDAMTKLRNDPSKGAAYAALAGGRGRLEDLGVPVPPVYADFLALGRFRTALVLGSIADSGTLTALVSALGP